jgi:hypothetical protein
MVSFIDAHRGEYGVESICAQLQIAPSQYYEHKSREAEPARLPLRLQRDRDSCRRSAAFTTRISASMARARCGGSFSARILPLLAARWSA